MKGVWLLRSQRSEEDGGRGGFWTVFSRTDDITALNLSHSSRAWDFRCNEMPPPPLLAVSSSVFEDGELMHVVRDKVIYFSR